METLFGSEPTKRRVLPPPVRRLIVDLEAEHPALNLNEIVGICYARIGRRPHLATVRSVFDENYPARSRHGPAALQEVLFSYLEAL